MPRSIQDNDVRLLAGIAETLRGDYVHDDNAWSGSPFAWIRTRPSRQKGKIVEQVIAGWCAAKGLAVASSGNSGFDRVIHGYRTEVKGSTLWGTGIYKFQQIRDQGYDYVICLGISPFDAHCWVVPKEVLLARPVGVTGQHTGAAGRDTAWLSFAPTKSPPWLARYGGRLRDAYRVLAALPPGPHA